MDGLIAGASQCMDGIGTDAQDYSAAIDMAQIDGPTIMAQQSWPNDHGPTIMVRPTSQQDHSGAIDTAELIGFLQAWLPSDVQHTKPVADIDSLETLKSKDYLLRPGESPSTTTMSTLAATHPTSRRDGRDSWQIGKNDCRVNARSSVLEVTARTSALDAKNAFLMLQPTLGLTVGSEAMGPHGRRVREVHPTPLVTQPDGSLAQSIMAYTYGRRLASPMLSAKAVLCSRRSCSAHAPSKTVDDRSLMEGQRRWQASRYSTG